jgi:pyruvate formate lyase activating enzyme
MLIGGIHRFSLIDYPSKISCIIFTPGCNFRCPFCHNPELVDPGNFKERVLPDVFFSFLRGRQGKLDGVVITGGEPTLQDDLADFIARIKELGFLVKLDTNGSNPRMLASLLKNKLLDYVAMDVKAPAALYAKVAGLSESSEAGDAKNTATVIEAVQTSISILLKSKIDYEFRTTVVEGLLSEKDILEIGCTIAGAKKYVLQRFVASKTLHPEFEQASSLPDPILQKLEEKLAAGGLQVIRR